MDIATAMATAAQALGIVKQLREIEKSVSEGELKAKMADLYVKLADVRMALADAQEELRGRDKTIKDLEARISELTSGEACPLCEAGELKVTASRKHPSFGFAGVQERTLSCDKCPHKETRIFDPEGRTKRS